MTGNQTVNRDTNHRKDLTARGYDLGEKKIYVLLQRTTLLPTYDFGKLNTILPPLTLSKKRTVASRGKRWYYTMDLPGAN